MNNHFLLTAAACAIAPLMLLGGSPARAADAPAQWTPYHDAHLGFTLEHPAGWTVRTQGNSIIAQNADHALLVLVDAFAAKPGDTAIGRVNTLAAAYPTLFRQSHAQRVAPQASASDAAAGALSYVSAQGRPSQVRVLCSIFQGSGMLYAVAGSNNRFPTERATLLRVLTSLRFGPPAGASATTNAATTTGGDGAAKTSPAEAALGLKFVKWTDPKEHAFRVEVPQGWTAEGGAYRFESTDIRPMIRLTSPGKNMMVQSGDQGLPIFMLPTPFNMRMYGVPEGVPFSTNHTFQNMLLRYMPAPDFNRWYVEKAVKQGIDDLSITKEQPMTELARQQTEALNKTLHAGQRGEVTMAEADFKGRSKETGKPIIGVLVSRVQIVSAPSAGDPIVQWNAQPTIMGYNDDDKAEAHQKVVLAVRQHLHQSYQEDPAFVTKLNKQIASDTAVIAQQANNSVALSKQRTEQIARDAETRRQAIMGSYWNRVDAGDNQQRQQANYYGNQTDVSNPTTGQAYKVGSGYSNYYLDPRTNTIIGTNSADRPPVDFTPLSEF